MLRRKQLSVVVSLLLGCVCLVKMENCPDGWVRFHESCYFFGDQFGFDYTEARHYCSQHSGSHLVDVGSAQEDKLIQDYAHRLFRAGTVGEKAFWMGATDDAIEGVWTWNTDSRPLTAGYSDWRPGQPEAGRDNEDCLCLFPPGYTWDDCICSEQHHPLCEKNTVGTLSPCDDLSRLMQIKYILMRQLLRSCLISMTNIETEIIG